jgi:hypothetical protein
MEKPRYADHAVLLHIFSDQINSTVVPGFDQEYLSKTFEKVRSQIINNEVVVPDDFCIDFHADFKIKKNDATRHKFRTIGAFVSNVCEKFIF